MSITQISMSTDVRDVTSYSLVQTFPQQTVHKSSGLPCSLAHSIYLIAGRHIPDYRCWEPSMSNQLKEFEEADKNRSKEIRNTLDVGKVGVNEREENCGVPERRYGNEKK